MNLDLEKLLAREGIAYDRMSKAEKVKLLTRWSGAFPELLASARRDEVREGVARDGAAAELYGALPSGDFHILPDDASAMPSCACFAARPPDLSELVSDTFTKCDELVVVDAGLAWSAVFVNHGSPSMVGRHFSRPRSPGAAAPPRRRG